MQGTKAAHPGPRKGGQGVADDAVKATSAPTVDARQGDQLIQIEEISELTTLSVPTLRWLRHRGEGPPMFKLHRRLVAWRSDCVTWINDQAAKDAEARAS